MGGRKRIVPPNSLVGVHRMVAIEQHADPAGGAMQQRFYSDGAMRDMLSRYSSSMGVSRDLITKAEQTPAESIHLLLKLIVNGLRGWRRKTKKGSRRGRRRSGAKGPITPSAPPPPRPGSGG